MKQNITIEQLNELSDKGKERLRDGWKPIIGDRVFSQGNNGTIKGSHRKILGTVIKIELNHQLGIQFDKGYWSFIQVHRVLPLLSIGQLIDFLDDHTKGHDLIIRIHSAGTGWKRPGEMLVDIDGLPVSEIEDETELCDALWEAVKEILNK